MPFFIITYCNSTPVKHEPLSETNISSNPCIANMTLSFSVVMAEVATLTTLTSFHFENQGQQGTSFQEMGLYSPHADWPHWGHSHGCKGAGGGRECLVIWHCWQLFTFASRSWSIPDHTQSCEQVTSCTGLLDVPHGVLPPLEYGRQEGVLSTVWNHSLWKGWDHNLDLVNMYRWGLQQLHKQHCLSQSKLNG